MYICILLDRGAMIRLAAKSKVSLFVFSLCPFCKIIPSSNAYVVEKENLAPIHGMDIC